jgi:ABC-type branched-subunit amino acid transport system substrate-binding protein
VIGVIGPQFSSLAENLAPLANILEKPCCSPSATSTVLSDKRDFEFFLRTVPSDAIQALILARLVSYFGWTTVACIHSQDS